MRLSFLAVLIALTGPAIWAQKYPKRPANGAGPDGTVRPQFGLHINSLKSHPRDLTANAAPPPAPGVAQCHVDASGALSAYFMNTSTIPAGSTITGSITLEDDGSSIDFTGETLPRAMTVGSVVFLPNIFQLGDLWYSNGAAFDIAVQVQPPGGTTTEVDCQVLVNEAFANSDLASNEPLISGFSQTLAANKDLELVLNGYFTTGTALVVLSDINSVYVVPPSAINLVSGNEIDVALSRIGGLDLTASDIFFLTVSQGGISDTIEYRYLPGTPGTFNVAPQ